MKLLTIAEISELLKLSRSKCYELVSNGALPSLKIDGAIRVVEIDLLAYLESCRRSEEKPKQRRVSIPRLKHIKLDGAD